MRALVTGASGLLGGSVAAALLAQGHEVRTFQRRPSGVAGAQDHRGDLSRADDVAAAVRDVDVVVHLAAKVSVSGPEEEYRRANVEGTRGLLGAARAAGVTRFVQVSSPSVAHTGRAIVGDDAGPAQPERARGPYARSKAAAELLALAADSAAMPVVAVRPHVVWGPGDTQLVERILARSAAGRLPLLSGGHALIDTTYLDNAAEAIVAAAHRAPQVHGQAFVVSNGEPRTVAEFLGELCRAAGVPAPHRSVPAGAARAAGALVERLWAVRPGADEPPMTRFLAEQLSTAHWFDQRRTRRALGWAPRVTLEQGFARIAASCRSA